MARTPRTSSGSSPTVLLWDSNPFNPYGAEVSRVIRDAGWTCIRVCRRNARFDSANEWAWIPTSRRDAPSSWHRALYLLALLRATVVVAVRRPVVVMPWLNTPYEQWMVRLWQILGIKTLVVHHDPTPTRSAGTTSRLQRRIRGRATHVLVHSERLIPLTENPARALVVGHPAYDAWVARYLPAAGGVAREPRCLWFGTARVDKGFALLPELATMLAESGVVLTVAPGVIDDEQRALVTDVDNLELVDEHGYLSDEALGRLLTASAVVAAPYRDITASGSVLLALSAARPVVAFDAPILRGILPDEHLVDPGDLAGFARACADAATAGPAPTYPRTSAEEADRAGRESWAFALDSARR